MWRVLCVDDKQEIAENIADYFTSWTDDNPFGEFSATIETSFEKAVERLTNEQFDLVTLDLHGVQDAEPIKDNGDGDDQEGKRVLAALRSARFIPVVFYSGYAEKIQSLVTGVVKVVKKGSDDLNDVRNAAREIYATGLPTLIRHIEEEKRTFVWDTVDKHWDKVGPEGTPEDLAYLLARRLATRFSRDSIKELLKHSVHAARPIEMYIYPPYDTSTIRTGCILKEDDVYWIVATPACDFAQCKADEVLLVRADALTTNSRYVDWDKTRWNGKGDKPSNKHERDYTRLRQLLTNGAGERYWFLAGTFFLPNLVVDFQGLRQVKPDAVGTMETVCRLDSPYQEEFISRLSRYYGRIGTPDLEANHIIEKL